MRTADALAGTTAMKPGIALAQHQRPGAAIGRIAGRTPAEIRKRQEARDIGVVHEERIAITVDFISPDPREADARPARADAAPNSPRSPARGTRRRNVHR